MSRHGLDETDPAAGGRRHFVNIKSSSDYARGAPYICFATYYWHGRACMSVSITYYKL
jgi:hypothetical protein